MYLMCLSFLCTVQCKLTKPKSIVKRKEEAHGGRQGVLCINTTLFVDNMDCLLIGFLGGLLV